MALSKINTRALANDSVTVDKVADNAVTTAMITDGTIGVTDLADGAITNAKVSSTAAIDASKLNLSGVTSAGITTLTGQDINLYNATDGNNALRFYDDDDLLSGGLYVWNSRLNIASYNSQDIALAPAGNVNITSGNFEVGGTTVIDSSRNVSGTRGTFTVDDNAEYSTTEDSELNPVGSDALYLYNDETSSTYGKVSLLMRSRGSGGAAAGRITLENSRSGAGAFNFFLRDNSHTGEQQAKLKLNSDGDLYLLQGRLMVNGSTAINQSRQGFFGHGTTIGNGGTIPTDGGTLQLTRSNNNPYIGFYSNDGTRNGYIQTLVNGEMYLANEEGGGWAFNNGTDNVALISNTGDLTSRNFKAYGSTNDYRGLIPNTTDINLMLGTGSGAEPRIYLHGTGNGVTSGDATAGNISIKTANSNKIIAMAGNVELNGWSYTGNRFLSRVTAPNSQLNYASEFRANGANVQLVLGRDGNAIGSGGIGANGEKAFLVYGFDSNGITGEKFNVYQNGRALAVGGIHTGSSPGTYANEINSSSTAYNGTGTLKIHTALNGSGEGVVISSHTRTSNDNAISMFRLIDRSGSTAFRVNVNGKVGIGTSAPEEKLTVQSNNANIRLYNSGGQGTSLVMLDTTWQGGLHMNAGNLYLRSGGQTNRWYVDTSGNFKPANNDAYDLGSTTNVIRNVYTGDLHLSNQYKTEGNEVDGTQGSWTIQEGEDDLFIINRSNGKKYRFALEEIA